MATGGIFQLITNDGKQDRMLMASNLLKQRLADARTARQNSGLADDTPTLYDIERTHILFTNAHFKPFAAIGYEYNKVKTNSGTAQITSTGDTSVSFSIPQFGDFFSDMVVHVIMSQPKLATSDTANRIIPDGDQNLMRWCHYPGERLLKRVRFNVNGNPLDEYSRDAVNFHREFQVQPNKELGWNRCMGQQEKEEGWLDQPNWAGNNTASNAVRHRTCMQTTSGLQTPTGQKTENVELFIPLLFWCNKDPRLAVPSVAIPYGQRFITLDLASSHELVGEVPRGVNAGKYDATSIAAGGALGEIKLNTIELYINNIFVNPEVHNIFIKRIGFTLIRVHREQKNEESGRSASSVLLQNLKWPIEALFIGMRIKDYSQNGDTNKGKQYLDRWHRFSSVEDTHRTTQGWKSQKATSVSGEGITDVMDTVTAASIVAAAGDFSGATLAVSPPGDAGVYLSPGDVLTFTDSASGNTFTATVASLDAAGSVVTFEETQDSLFLFDNFELVTIETICNSAITKLTSSEADMTVQICASTFKNVTIQAHGIPIYNKFPVGFYNAYLPLTYGGHNIRTPKDCGAVMITFCLYPGTYQPSGHINVSRAREFYLDYECTDIIGGEGGKTGSLVIVASAINFLLISDGSAVLRYST